MVQGGQTSTQPSGDGRRRERVERLTWRKEGLTVAHDRPKALRNVECRHARLNLLEGVVGAARKRGRQGAQAFGRASSPVGGACAVGGCEGRKGRRGGSTGRRRVAKGARPPVARFSDACRPAGPRQAGTAAIGINRERAA
jgi:hypothetical protein